MESMDQRVENVNNLPIDHSPAPNPNCVAPVRDQTSTCSTSSDLVRPSP